MKSTCGGTRLELRNKKVENFSIKKLTRRKVFNLKPDTLYIFNSEYDKPKKLCFKTWRVVKFLIQNHGFQDCTKMQKNVVLMEWNEVKLDFLHLFFFEIWHLEKILIENLILL